MERAVIQDAYEASQAHEVSVDWNGWNFLIIYGKAHKDWFIAIPNHNVCIIACEPEDVIYNSRKLANVFNNEDKGQVLAEVIREHWSNLNKIQCSHCGMDITKIKESEEK